jgi:predicted TIM-barrel fold metal-dependent hydrolase
MIVDVHAHYHPRAFTEALARLEHRGRPGGFAGHPDTDDEAHVQTRLEMMEDAGVGMQVLSPAAGRAPYGQDETAAVDAARIGNDRYAELVRHYPERFKAFVSLPLPHVDASLRELTRGIDELGMLGVNLHCAVLTRSVVDDEYRPIFEELDRRHGVILFHPCGNSIFSPMIADYGFGTAVGTSLEDAVVVLHLIGKRFPAQYPNITFIVPHLGGPIPMLLQRLDNQYSMQQRDLPEPPSVTARRFYYDTVGHGSPAGLTCAWKAFGADHVLPGSDFPVLLSYETYRQTFGYIREVGLPDADVEQILERTAPAVLKL